MCGFVGAINKAQATKDEMNRELLQKMNECIVHRGPDDTGYYVDKITSLGFKRLSIIDIDAGHQPITYDNGRYVMVFNGEIYNYIELREMLIRQGFEFTTNSDSEVILALYAFCEDDVVGYLRGMFAFLIWDREKSKLFGARDPFGIKPLYYYDNDEIIVFASEAKSIIPVVTEGNINEVSLHHYFTYQYVPEDNTLWKNIRKVDAGCCFTYESNKFNINKYWEPEFKKVKRDEKTTIEEVRKVIKDSVKIHLRSDVPVGAFLSGGIDSTIIAAETAKLKPDLLTFTVGFKFDGYSEYEVAKLTAEKLGVKNIYTEVSVEEFINELPKIVWHMDDPLADPSCVPLYFLAREASKHVKVVLSGEGSDELFGGYNIYHEPESLKIFKFIPKPVKTLLKQISNELGENVKGKSFLRRGCVGLEERYFGNARIFSEEEKQKLLKSYNENISYTDVTRPLYAKIENYHDVSKMQYIDINTWLKGDILLKADKMTMAHSLELRVPFLDKEVFKVASSLDPKLNVTKTTTKAILRKAFEKEIPEHVVNRRKLGFPVPIRHWLKKELYDWAEYIITSSQADEFINKEYVLKLLYNHKYGNVDYSRRIWTAIIFMMWHKVFIEKKYCDINTGKYKDFEDVVVMRTLINGNEFYKEVV